MTDPSASALPRQTIKNEKYQETRVVDTQYAAPLATAGKNEVVPTE